MPSGVPGPVAFDSCVAEFFAEFLCKFWCTFSCGTVASSVAARMQRIGAWLLSLALLKATASEQSSGAVETSEHDSVCAGGEFCGQESDPSSTASDNDLPPILNFGSLDGYYRVLAGEIGIVGVRYVQWCRTCHNRDL